MDITFVGREKERVILEKAMISGEAEMVAVIGRRRIGKTFLVRSVYGDQVDFEITGIQDASMAEQLQNFAFQLQMYADSGLPVKQPDNWLEAFQMLITFLEKKPKDRKQVVFLDELPWLATRRSGFLKALGFFWNSWAVKKNVIVVMCGSAASWMIRKVVHQKGGLHNRITRLIELRPFTLNETEAFLKSRGVRLNRYQVVQLYMAIGGVPHYLKEVEAGKSAAQNIDQICFSELGLLRDEFLKLYPALFEKSDRHIRIIRTLAKKRRGLTRREIIENSKLGNGGGMTRLLEELNQSGFITAYHPFGKKKKDTLYRLSDEYSLFYLEFIENKKNQGSGTWQHLSQTQTWKSWSGFAFESICLKHISQIKKALGISGIYTLTSAFSYAGDEDRPGIQIDLVIDRKDQVINLFELKFYNSEFRLSKSGARELREKMATFRAVTGTRKQVFLNLITPFGLIPNEHSIGLVDQDFTMDILFKMDDH